MNRMIVGRHPDCLGWIRRQPQAFFEKGIRMLPERWKKCADSGGEYIED
jgi:hypothetical protein